MTMNGGHSPDRDPLDQANPDRHGEGRFLSDRVNQDKGKRLIKIVIAIALTLVVAVFLVVLLVSGRTDDDKPEEPRPAVSVTTSG